MPVGLAAKGHHFFPYILTSLCLQQANLVSLDYQYLVFPPLFTPFIVKNTWSLKHSAAVCVCITLYFGITQRVKRNVDYQYDFFYQWPV